MGYGEQGGYGGGLPVAMTELAMRKRCRKRSEFIRTLSKFSMRAERCHGILL